MQRVLLLALVFASAIFAQTDYGIILDAGSSSTKLHIYQWPHRVDPSIPLVEAARDNITQTEETFKKSPGISTFATNLGGIATYLQQFIDYAKTTVPAAIWATTPIYLRATAGMRLLPQTDQDNIISVVVSVLSTSGFLWENNTWAKVITGEQEGVYGWITSNYLNGNIISNSPSTVGILDMGGASTQITFVPSSVPTAERYDLDLNQQTYVLYTHSFLGYGQDQGYLLYQALLAQQWFANGSIGVNVNAACLLNGYNESYYDTTLNATLTLVGTGDEVTCAMDTLTILDVAATCTTSPCSFDGVYQAPLNGQYYCINGYDFTANFFFPGPISLSLSPDALQNAAAGFCGTLWTDAEASNPTVSASFLKLYCFNGNYFTNILRSFGVPGSTNLTFLSLVNNTDPGWALGNMIFEANLLPFGGGSTSSSTTAATSATSSSAVTSSSSSVTSSSSSVTSSSSSVTSSSSSVTSSSSSVSSSSSSSSTAAPTASSSSSSSSSSSNSASSATGASSSLTSTSSSSATGPTSGGSGASGSTNTAATSGSVSSGSGNTVSSATGPSGPVTGSVTGPVTATGASTSSSATVTGNINSTSTTSFASSLVVPLATIALAVFAVIV